MQLDLLLVLDGMIGYALLGGVGGLAAALVVKEVAA